MRRSTAQQEETKIMDTIRRTAVAAVLIAMVVASLGLVGCPGPEATDDAGEEAVPPGALGEMHDAEIKIGALFALTGKGSSLGEPERDTAVMLEKQINDAGGIDGRPIKLIVRDTKSLEDPALNAARELVEKENVVAIIGPSRSGTTMALIDYVEREGVPLISCAAARAITDPVKEWVFQVAPGDRDAVHNIYTYMQNNGISKIATLTASSGFGIEGLKQLEAQAPDFGIEIVANEQFNDTDTDMTPQLTNIRGTDAQAVVCWGIGPAPALVAKNMQQLGMDIQLFQSHGVANEDFIKGAGEAANGVIMPAAKLIVLDQLAEDDPQIETLREYHDMFVEEYGREPDHYGGHGWDAMHILTGAIERAGGGAERAKIREEIEAVDNYVGVAGVFDYSADDHYGLSPEAFVMVQIQDGEWTLVE